MPFTVSHAVAVLPLATGRPGRELWPAALVIGSMVPDLPYFVPPHRGSNWSHAASGPVTINLALGLLVFALWVLVLRRPLVDLAPRWLADRLPPPRSLSAVGWVQAGVSVVIGALTHVVWDSLTHPHRWGTDHLATLNRGLGPLPAYQWLQYGSGVLGLLALTVWTVLWVRSRRPRSISHRWALEARTRAWVSVAAAFVGAGTGYWGPAVMAGRAFDEPVVVRAVTGTISVTGAAVLAVCLLWQAGRVLSSDDRVVRERPTDRGQG